MGCKLLKSLKKKEKFLFRSLTKSHNRGYTRGR